MSNVSIQRTSTCLPQDEAMSNSSTCFIPDFTQVYAMLCEIVEITVGSVLELPRVEYQLFQAMDDLQQRHLWSIELDSSNVKEEILEVVKTRLQRVVDNNSHGPQR